MGQWGPVVDWPVVGVHVALLPNGKVLAYDSIGDNATETYPVQDHTRATVWDPATGTQTPVNVTRATTSSAAGWRISWADPCSSPAGTRTSSSTASSRRTSSIPTTNTWSLGPNMAAGRWYPSVTPLRNGESADHLRSGVDTPEVRMLYGALRTLSTALAEPAAVPVDGCRARTAARSTPAPTRRCGASIRPAPARGRAFGQRDSINRDYGSHALFDVGKMLVAGGGVLDAPTRASSTSTGRLRRCQRRRRWPSAAASTTSPFSPTAPSLRPAGTPRGRRLVDLNNGVYPAEQWNPATGQWRTLAAMQITRQYHSTALLLPDGRVLSSGGGICGTCDTVGYLAKNAEIFSRPYLFQGRRHARAAPGHHRRAGVDRPTARRFRSLPPTAASIRKIALVRLGAVTHSVNMEQRYMPLSVHQPASRTSPRPPPSMPTSHRRASTCSSSSTPTACPPWRRWCGLAATPHRRRRR